MMVIADRLKVLREEKKMSQADIEKRAGLLQVYISRVASCEGDLSVPFVIFCFAIALCVILGCSLTMRAQHLPSLPFRKKQVLVS
jgi:transcriptional regulator with XRE-family HTH domain